MSSFDVTFQLVDSPQATSEMGGTVTGDQLISVFRDFPFPTEIARARRNATFPTITFRRLSDGEEVAVWTDNAHTFDLCLVKDGKKSFLNTRSKEQVEEILTRFRTESISALRSPSLWRRIFE